MKIHIHRWKKYYDIFFGTVTYDIKRTYRHCWYCDRWQRYYSDEYGGWWEDSNTPKGLNSLLEVKYADIEIKKIKMERESME
jgi:hypothetical protein